MPEREGGHGRYVRRVSEDLRRYTRSLLEENARLRARVASLTAENDRHKEEAAGRQELVREVEALRERARHAEEDRAWIESQLHEARLSLQSHERESARLAAQLAVIDDDNRRFMDQFVALEQQNNNLANLYVASFRLHSTLDRNEVIAALLEILANLVGTEEVALFEVDAARPTLTLVASNGIQAEAYMAIPRGRGWIGGAVSSGETFIRDNDISAGVPFEEHLTACVPLKLDGQVRGAVAIFRLLPQKPGIEDLDRELFDLLGSHVAMALYCTSLHERFAGAGS
jgi:nitrate/nitrite-specific signal transduction histidine kinase